MLRRINGRRCWIIAPLAMMLALLSVCVVYSLTKDDIRYAAAQGDKVAETKSMIIDVSNAEQGYVMFKCKVDTKKDLKLRIMYEGKTTYTYNVINDGAYHCYPLQRGSGTYDFYLYIQAKGTSYNQQSMKSVKVKIADENAVFLYPNLYAWYTKDSSIVQVALDLNAGKTTQEDIVKAVKEYVTRTISYDHFGALLVKRGYTPDLDKVLSSNKGICFDYAAVTVALLRMQGIPARLCMGEADNVYHAWTSIYLNGQWEDYDPTYAVSGTKAKNYTLEAYY